MLNGLRLLGQLFKWLGHCLPSVQHISAFAVTVKISICSMIAEMTMLTSASCRPRVGAGHDQVDHGRTVFCHS